MKNYQNKNSQEHKLKQHKTQNVPLGMSSVKKRTVVEVYRNAEQVEAGGTRRGAANVVNRGAVVAAPATCWSCSKFAKIHPMLSDAKIKYIQQY